MKNRHDIAYIALLLLAVCSSACSDKFINYPPPSINSAEGFFNTEDGINQAVIGAYNGLKEVEASNFAELMNEERSDNVWTPSVVSSYNDLSVQKFLVSSSEPFLDDAWSDAFDVIHRCNLVIENIGGIAFSDTTLKSRYTGEMEFIRALMYFDLVRYFGGVPLVTNSVTPDEAVKIKRATVQETYDLIVSDLKDAIDRLPKSYSSEDVGRATKYSAEGLLGRVYITMSGYPLNAKMWSAAKDVLGDIISSGQFQFLPVYADVFSLANENGPQCVFYVQFKAGANDVGNPIPTRNASNDVNPNTFPFGGSPDAPIISQDLINSYEPGDIRFKNDIRLKWVNKSGDTVANQPTILKFAVGQPAKASDWDINWPVIRYGDVLMMYAECLNELGYEADGQALQILNKIRTRAGLSPKKPSDIPNQESFRTAMQHERRHEFAFENLRWNDLVRTDEALDVMQSFLNGYGMAKNLKNRDQYLYPIPLQVLEVNPSMSQNPGY